MPVLRLKDIPTLPLEALFKMVMTEKRSAVADPETGLTPEDLDRILLTQMREADREAREAKTFAETSRARLRWREIETNRKLFRDRLRAHAAWWMRNGLWVGFGLLENQLVLVPKADWSGALDWNRRTLTTPGRVYENLQIMPVGLPDEQLAMVNELYAKVNGELPIAPRRGKGRPSAAPLITQLYNELEQTLPEEVSAAARVIAKRLATEHPTAAPTAARTIEKQISARHRAAREARALAAGQQK